MPFRLTGCHRPDARQGVESFPEPRRMARNAAMPHPFGDDGSKPHR